MVGNKQLPLVLKSDVFLSHPLTLTSVYGLCCSIKCHLTKAAKRLCQFNMNESH